MTDVGLTMVSVDRQHLTTSVSWAF